MLVIGSLEVPILYYVRAQIRPDVGTRFDNNMGNSRHLMNMLVKGIKTGISYWTSLPGPKRSYLI